MSHLVEVFSGIQGEGPIVGYRQLFVRFSKCQLACNYCDTDFKESQHANVEVDPGLRNFALWKNPCSMDDLSNHLLRMNQALQHHSVSLTGGEPLLHVDSLRVLLPKLRDGGLRIYLETNGLLHRELQQIINFVDMIGMDVKLQSETGQLTEWEEHEKFLSIAKDKDTFVKVVVSNQTKVQDIERIALMVSRQAPTIPLVLQPLTPTKGLRPPTPEYLIVLMDGALKVHHDVRVIPQTHVMLDQR